MGAATSFSDLKAAPVSRKIAVVEATVGEQPIGWSQVGAPNTNAYSVSYKYETVTLTTGPSSKILKAVTDVKENGTSLTEKTSVTDVHATAGSWYHDVDNGTLYVRTTGTVDPDTSLVVAYFKLYFASEDGVHLNDVYWEPYLVSIPNASQQVESIFFGTSVFGNGDVALLNTHGFFDTLFGKWIWERGEVVCKIGGDNLNYEEYQTVFTGIVDSKRWSETEVVLSLISKHQKLERTLPKNVYTTTAYPNLEGAAEGRPIPIAYGIFTDDAPLVTCIDTAYTGGKRQFKICDHAIVSIQQVQVDFGDGAGWQNISHGDVSLSAATFTVLNSDFLALGADGWVEGSTKVRVKFNGRDTTGGGTAQQVGANIVKDLLTDSNYGLGLPTSDLDTTEFTDSAGISDMTLNVFIDEERSAIEWIDKIARSDHAFFFAKNDGKLVYRTWEPTDLATTSTFDRTDFLDQIDVEFDPENFYTEVGVQYAERYSTGEFLQVVEAATDEQNLFGEKTKKQFETFVSNNSDAVILAGRILLFGKSPNPSLTFKTKLQGFTLNIGDKIAVTSARAPIAGGAGWEGKVFEVTSITRDFGASVATVVCDYLKGVGDDIGIWSPSTAPAWASASETEKLDQGFWTDVNGFADPNDQTSKNVSLWW
jgi:hypothetical protein